MLLLLGACSNGDFGRPRAWFFTGEPAADTLAVQAYAPDAASTFLLTDDERYLRQLADGLLTVPFAQSRWFITAPGGHGHVLPPPVAFDRGSYAANLLGGHFRSATSRYARLIDDIRNDIQRMPPFFAAARRVADLDDKRARSLAHVSTLSPAELANTQARIRENIAVMASVREALHERAAGYRFALERLVLALPSPMAAEADRLWSQLDRQVGEVQIVAALPIHGKTAGAGEPPAR